MSFYPSPSIVKRKYISKFSTHYIHIHISRWGNITQPVSRQSKLRCLNEACCQKRSACASLGNISAHYNRGVPVPFACKLRKDRIHAIGTSVAASSYDIVVFQEIWNKGDYEVLKSKICGTLPYCHYFFSGMIGSGLCVFARYPIQQTLYHKFPLNGYAHKIQHGDWFGGKGVGLARFDIDGFSVHVYVSHVHAEYNRHNDEYLPHRVSQAFNLSEFIKLTRGEADLTLLCGDMNLEPCDLGYKIIRENGNLNDAWLDKKNSTTDEPDGNTCDCPSNSFCENKDLVNYPNGKRIDYILYNSGKGVDVDVKECTVTMGRVPGQSFNFSDHEGVAAELVLNHSKSGAPSHQMEPVYPLLEEALMEVDRGLAKTRSDNRFFLLFAIACLMIAYLMSVVHIPYPLDYGVSVMKVILNLATGFGLIQNLVLIRSEVHGLEATKEDIKHLLRNRK